jgi:hypothetical protein
MLHKLLSTNILPIAEAVALRRRHGKPNPITAPAASPVMHKRTRARRSQ